MKYHYRIPAGSEAIKLFKTQTQFSLLRLVDYDAKLTFGHKRCLRVVLRKNIYN